MEENERPHLWPEPSSTSLLVCATCQDSDVIVGSKSLSVALVFDSTKLP